MNQKLGEQYRRNRDDYATRFPAAYRFLVALENGAPHGLWLSTAVNAHLYKNNAFLSYIRFGNVQHAAPTLVLSPCYHIRIAETASDQAHLLYPTPFLQTVRKHTVDRPDWWVEHPNEAFELRNTTPQVVFDDLLDLLRNIEVPTAGDLHSPPTKSPYC